MKEYLLMFKNTFNFSGKSSRREFWMAFLVNSIVNVSLFIFALPLIGTFDAFVSAYTSVAGLYEILVTIPFFSLTFRRLKDTGRSGWWAVISLFSGIGTIILIVWLAQPSSFRVNVWYDGYKDNPDEIKIDDVTTVVDVKQNKTQNSQNINAEQTQNQNNDSIEKIIEELNELKQNNKISQQEYEEILSKLTKK